jgi:hypothetical protein
MSVARLVGLAAPFAVCLLLASPASGQAKAHTPSKAERAAARDAYDKGKAAFDKGDYAKALDSFVKANAKIPSVQAMFWIGQAHDKLGHTDPAIRVYEDISAHPDFSKLSEDKQATVRQRLAALKPPPASPEPPRIMPPPPPPAAPASEPTPTPDPTPPPPPAEEPTSAPVSEPPAAPPSSPLEPARDSFELGITGGVSFIADANNFVERGMAHTRFKTGVGEAGLRAAFFPAKAFGLEAEWVHGFGVSKAQNPYPSSAANFDAVSGHLIGQLPNSRFVPFVLVGAGIVNASSKPGGDDVDFLLQAGVGAKVFVTKLLVPRLDFRLNMTQREGGGFADGVAVHPELLLGLSFRLGN